MKTCSKCGQSKTESEFYSDKYKPTGLTSACKFCCSASRKAYYKTHREQAIKKRGEYREQHREQDRAYQAAWMEAHPGYRQAWSEAHKEEKKAYLKAHEKQLKAYHKAYRDERKEQMIAYQKAYRVGRKEQRSLNNKAWRKSHPEEVWLLHHIGYAKRWSAEGQFSLQQWLELKARYDNKCLCCGRQEPEVKLTPDHVISLSKGGSNWIENIQPLCKNCNSSKNRGTTDFRLLQLEWRIA